MRQIKLGVGPAGGIASSGQQHAWALLGAWSSATTPECKPRQPPSGNFNRVPLHTAWPNIKSTHPWASQMPCSRTAPQSLLGSERGQAGWWPPPLPHPAAPASGLPAAAVRACNHCRLNQPGRCCCRCCHRRRRHSGWTTAHCRSAQPSPAAGRSAPPKSCFPAAGQTGDAARQHRCHSLRHGCRLAMLRLLPAPLPSGRLLPPCCRATGTIRCCPPAAAPRRLLGTLPPPPQPLLGMLRRAELPAGGCPARCGWKSMGRGMGDVTSHTRSMGGRGDVASHGRGTTLQAACCSLPHAPFLAARRRACPVGTAHSTAKPVDCTQARDPGPKHLV